MDVKLFKSELCGRVTVPPSKSVAHRLMIATALAGEKFAVDNGGKDIEATERCLDELYPFLQTFLNKQNTVDFKNISNNKLAFDDMMAQYADSTMDRIATVLNAGESGSTLRFLLPIVCALGICCEFRCEGRLAERPLDELCEVLKKHGGKLSQITDKQLPLKVSGKLRAGEYKIDGGISSQYITGLLFALPLLDGDSRIIIEGELVSKNYVDITLGVLDTFGIKIEKAENGFFVAGNQKYVVPENLSVEDDWSSAGFLLALGVLSGEVRTHGLNANSSQGDKVVVDILKRAGANIEWVDGEIVAKKSELSAVDFDAQDCPDAVPIMATVLSFAKGVSHISHVDRLRAKESDRLQAVRDMLADFGIRTEYSNDVLSVYGGEHTPCKTHGFNDHRMAMSAIVCALCTDGESEVQGVECIAKSYPMFIEHVREVGGKIFNADRS